jgi:hypothetical protein
MRGLIHRHKLRARIESSNERGDKRGDIRAQPRDDHPAEHEVAPLRDNPFRGVISVDLVISHVHAAAVNFAAGRLVRRLRRSKK